MPPCMNEGVFRELWVTKCRFCELARDCRLEIMRGFEPSVSPGSSAIGGRPDTAATLRADSAADEADL